MRKCRRRCVALGWHAELKKTTARCGRYMGLHGSESDVECNFGNLWPALRSGTLRWL
ncbi:hypothetical protein JK635_01410 [Neobacillus sp. YIM B02564]|uniref:Uncharacterized protein n=1 Tax=Neobacillus paridis TaxID=2803862 RepID=A0ABS1THV2_9BACI|nr:hypothetical protein [Neobacillus paridis]MBL4950900.1 hypothetical protein [Neobacillus paridis]